MESDKHLPVLFENQYTLVLDGTSPVYLIINDQWHYIGLARLSRYYASLEHVDNNWFGHARDFLITPGLFYIICLLVTGATIFTIAYSVIPDTAHYVAAIACVIAPLIITTNQQAKNFLLCPTSVSQCINRRTYIARIITLPIGVLIGLGVLEYEWLSSSTAALFGALLSTLVAYISIGIYVIRTFAKHNQHICVIEGYRHLFWESVASTYPKYSHMLINKKSN